jgi:recombination protein RecA
MTKQAASPGKTHPVMSKEKAKALELAIGQIEKAFGKGAIMKLGSERAAIPIASISTGSLGLDHAIGIGGLPCGRVVEIYGPEGSGKTTLALTVVAQAQRQGGTAVFIDAEHAFPAEFATTIGVDLDDLHVSQPSTGEEALEIADQLVRSGAVDVIVIDSVAALVPKAEIEGEMGDSHVGLQARLMSQALRKLTATVAKSNTCIIFINQLRMKIGIMFGNPETTTGGNALKFYASVRLDIRRIASIKERDDVVGNRVKVKVAKNKVAAPFKSVEFDIYFDEGISRSGEILDMSVEKNLVEKSGTWFSYKNERLGQGREAARAFLKQHPETMEELEHKVRSAMGLPALSGATPVPDAAILTSAAGEDEGLDANGRERLKVKAKA